MRFQVSKLKVRYYLTLTSVSAVPYSRLYLKKEKKKCEHSYERPSKRFKQLEIKKGQKDDWMNEVRVLTFCTELLYLLPAQDCFPRTRHHTR